ncbi:MAG TPA: PfkB family carbohydrate kinase [Tepidisphaeraceae bacterium]|nr:PfkB family carbohydrate kinase [Tepidisphaeraceae bacterium]
MPSTRQEICRSTAQKLNAALPTIGSIKATVGFDGFVDEIIAVVDKRHDFERFDPVRTISALGGKITAAAGQSSNYELIVKQMKLGGNGPIMANALAAAGLGVTYVGNLGYPTVHQVFAEFASRSTVISIGEPGHTDALEFDDGKVMLGKITAMNDVNWDNLVARVGEAKLKSLLSSSQLVATVNWTMLPHMSAVWKKLLEHGVPSRAGQSRILFVDLADPEKRNIEDIREAMDLLSQFQKQVDVVLGLNLKEAGEICHVLDLPISGNPEAQIEPIARAIREKLDLSCVVVHPRRGAAAATKTESGAFAGPFVQQPKISTGAGDHFNAGFCLGRVLGLNLEESLCTGCATSGFYVRTAKSPTAKELAEFVAVLPEPQYPLNS